jgi:hypothetical protein
VGGAVVALTAPDRRAGAQTARRPQAPPAPPRWEIDGPAGAGQAPAQPVGGSILGEVALTYICTGGCFGNEPQGVARLIEGEVVPLPLVITAVPTAGVNGPFGFPVADGGPMGLTWGEDLELYVGNANQNGDYDTAKLNDASTQLLTSFPIRVTASTPVSAVHLLLALDSGELLRFNTKTLESVPVAALGVGVTSLSHDAFSGKVYASLSDLAVVTIDPFSGEQASFAEMPALGRVALSPAGKLWYAPAKYLVGEDVPLTSWELPTSW